MEVTTVRHALERWKHYAIDSSGFVSDDSGYSNKAVVAQLLDSRANITGDALEFGKNVSEFMVQTLPCVEVVELDRNKCPCAPASGCYWLKTKAEIPKFIKMISVTGIVANSEMPRFNWIKWDRFQYIPKARLKSTQKGRYWTIRDTGEGSYIYLYGDRFLQSIAVSAIWEDPMCAAAYPSCGEVNINAKCNPLDVNFHTDRWMLDLVISDSWQKIISKRQSARTDLINDDKVSNDTNITNLS